MGKLRRKHRKFVNEYLRDFNATQAAIRAGYSERSARQQAHILLTIPDIRSAVDAAVDEQLAAKGVNKSTVLTEIINLARSDVRKLYNDDGSLKNPRDWDDATAAAISSVEVFENRDLGGHTKKVRLWDKSKNLENLARYLKLLVDRSEQQHKFPDGIPLTNFPPTPQSIDEWQRQVEEAEKSRLQRQGETA